MDIGVKTMLDSYMSTFDAYPSMSDALKAEVEQWKSKTIALAESTSDAMTFMTRFMGEGLQDECTAILTKAAMASYQQAEAVQPDQPAKTSALPTVSEFLEQYRASYETVKADGYRKRGEAAYEQLLGVAGRTDDLIEAQIIIEQEELFWKIVKDDSLDIFQSVLEAMDPLNPSTTRPLLQHVNAYKQSSGAEELTYRLDLLQEEKAGMTAFGGAKIAFAAQLATYLLEYNSARMSLWSWNADRLAMGGLAAMIKLRASIRKTLEAMKKVLDMTFDELLDDEGMKIWLLSPQSADALGRIKTAMLPQNYEAFRDIVNNEILADIPITEIAMRQPATAVTYSLKKEHDSFADFARKEADRLNAGLTYYQYSDKLEATAAAYAPKK